MSEELKACPFCNAEADILYDEDDHGHESGCIVCTNINCGCDGEWFDESDLCAKLDAIENWNTRPIEEALRQQLSTAQKEVEAEQYRVECWRELGLDLWTQFSLEVHGSHNDGGLSVLEDLDGALTLSGMIDERGNAIASVSTRAAKAHSEETP